MRGIGLVLWRRGLIVFAAAVLGSCGFAASASAAPFTVDSTSDYPQDLGGATWSTVTSSNSNWGHCVATNGGKCTLRAAVEAANEVGGASTISLPSGTIKLTIPPGSGSTSRCNPSVGDLDVNAPPGSALPTSTTGANPDRAVRAAPPG